MAEWAIGLQLALLVGLVGGLLWRYSAPYVSWITRILVFIAWLCSFSIVVVLPLDIYYSLNKDTVHLLPVWRGVYWATFLLAWLVLPLLQEYEEAGEFTTVAKLKRSLRNNLCFYAVMIVVGVIGIIFLVIRKQFSFKDLLDYSAVASNAFGLLLLVLFLSHGLSEMPKRCWRMRSLDLVFRSVCFNLAVTRERKEELYYEL